VSGTASTAPGFPDPSEEEQSEEDRDRLPEPPPQQHRGDEVVLDEVDRAETGGCDHVRAGSMKLANDARVMVVTVVIGPR
jgi:hypothetical protein